MKKEKEKLVTTEAEIKASAAKKARAASVGQSVVGTAVFTGSVAAFLGTYLALTTETLLMVLGGASVGIAVASYAANNEKTRDLTAGAPQKPKKLSLKSETFSAFSIFATILGFAAKPLAWLIEAVAWPLAVASAFLVGLATWWKNKQHEKLRPETPAGLETTSPDASEKWNALGPELQAKIMKLEDLTTEKVCGGVVATIFGGITGAALFAVIKTCSIFAFAAAFPPVGIIIGICLLAATAARQFYKKFVKGVKAEANKNTNEMRKDVGLAPKLEDHQTRSSTSTFLMAASTFLGVLALITNPIVKLIDAVGAAVSAACVYFMALFSVRSRAVCRAGLVTEVKTKLGAQPDSTLKILAAATTQSTSAEPKPAAGSRSPQVGGLYSSFFAYHNRDVKSATKSIFSTPATPDSGYLSAMKC